MTASATLRRNGLGRRGGFDRERLARHVLGQRYRVQITAGLLPYRRGDGQAKSQKGEQREAADQTP